MGFKISLSYSYEKFKFSIVDKIFIMNPIFFNASTLRVKASELKN